MLSSFFKNQGSDDYDPFLITLWVLLILVVAIWVCPFIFILFTSLKTNGEVITTSAFSFQKFYIGLTMLRPGPEVDLIPHFLIALLSLL